MTRAVCSGCPCASRVEALPRGLLSDLCGVKALCSQFSCALGSPRDQSSMLKMRLEQMVQDQEKLGAVSA